MYELARKLFQKSLDFHIRLLSVCYTKHKATEEVYQLAFDIMHEMWEMEEAIGMPIIEDSDDDAMIVELYDDFVAMKSKLQSLYTSTKDWGMQTLIGDKLKSINIVISKLESLIDKD